MIRGAETFQGPLPQKGSSPGMRSAVTTHGQQKSCGAILTVRFCGPWEGAGASQHCHGGCQCAGTAELHTVSLLARSDREQPGGGEEGGEDLPVHAPEAAAHLVCPPTPAGQQLLRLCLRQK